MVFIVFIEEIMFKITKPDWKLVKKYQTTRILKNTTI